MGHRALTIFLIVLVLAIRGTVLSAPKQNPSEPVITNTFFETDLRQALVDMSAQAGIPLIPDQSVQGTISVELKEVPLEKALEMVVASGGYTFRKMDGYYLIGQAVPENPSFKLLTVTEQIKPNYLKAKQALELFQEFFKSFIQVSEETNTLTVTASPDILERIKRDLGQFDRPPRQVMIEALVTELSDDAKKSLGINWTWDWADATKTGKLSLTDLAIDLTFTSTPAQLTRQVLAKLNALAEQGKATIRANPRIMTIEGQEASIVIGSDEFFLVNIGSVAFPTQTLQKVQAGITLKLTPFVTDKREITMKLEPEVSDVTSRSQVAGQPIITIGRRSASTTIRVKDGESIILGGLVQERTADRLQQIPILGDIPLLGKAFRKTTTSTLHTEVVIFITPNLLEAPQQAAQAQQPRLGLSDAQQPTGPHVVVVTPPIIVRPTGAFVTSQQPSPSRSEPYPDRMQRKIFKTLVGLRATAPQGRVWVTFTVASNGQLVGEPEAISPDDPALEAVAQTAVKRAAPFDPLPPEESSQQQTFSLTIIFEP